LAGSCETLLGESGTQRGNGMAWLDRIQRAVGIAVPSSRRSEAVRLRAEVVRLYREGRLPEAAQSARELLDWQRAELGEDHPDYARGLLNLALILRKQGDRREASRAASGAAALRRSILGADHPDTVEADLLVTSLRSEGPPKPTPPPEPPPPAPVPTGVSPEPHPLDGMAPGILLAIAELSGFAPETETER
jgi:hypothetical protein